MMKNCDVCGSEFEARGKAGRAKRCSRECWLKAKRSRYHETYKEAQWAQQKEYREAHREAILARKREYYQTHKVAISEKARERYEAHKEEILARHSDYKKSPRGKEVSRKGSHKRRAIERGVESDGIHYELEDKCVVCYSTEDLTVDHMVAIANGGTDTIDNKTTMCKSCNSSKGNHIDYRDPGFTVWIVRRRLGK
jgi:5-methylcytosine-specific restriction endonuclease McrA